jgi:hypothetical protein
MASLEGGPIQSPSQGGNTTTRARRNSLRRPSFLRPEGNQGSGAGRRFGRGKGTRMIIQKIERADRAPRDHLEAEANGHCRGPCACHSQRLYMDVRLD